MSMNASEEKSLNDGQLLMSDDQCARLNCERTCEAAIVIAVKYLGMNR